MRAEREAFQSTNQELNRQRSAWMGYHWSIEGPNRLRLQESPGDRPTKSWEEFFSVHAELIERLHRKAQAARWGLTRERLAQALRRSAEHRFGGASPEAAEVAAYLESLYAEDVALACACSDANEQAWEHFVGHYRENLYAAARAITGSSRAARPQARPGGDEAEARDLADSLYAELYGLEQTEQPSPGAGERRRRSLFDYFHGRSKLSTWLRAVLAQRYVDAIRGARRIESLDEREEADFGRTLRTGGAPPSPDPDRERYLALLQAALLAALAALGPRDRLRLAYYYVQERTLAEIGRILGEHEASASRNLDRTRRELRKEVERRLREQKQLSDAQIRLCFEYALEEWPFDLTRALSVCPEPSRKVPHDSAGRVLAPETAGEPRPTTSALKRNLPRAIQADE